MKPVLFVLIVVFSLPIQAVEIENFRSGLLCNDNAKNHWICHQSDTLYITGQGTCRDNGKLESCDWHGFSFDYSGFKENEIFECTQLSSLEKIEKEVDVESNQRIITKSFELDVPIGDGHFFNPQNSVFGTLGPESRMAYSRTSCFVNGTKVFEFELNSIYPSDP